MNFNCAFTVIDGWHAIYDLMYLAMCGTGVGFRVLPDDVAKLPEVMPHSTLTLLPYEPVPAWDRRADTVLEYRRSARHYMRWAIRVGDSKEGWAEAVRLYLAVLADEWTQDPEATVEIDLDFNHVRPAGERLKTMGGRASGPEALMALFTAIHKVLKHGPRLRPIDVLDICNAVGQAVVVVGGVRRTSEIARGSPKDAAFIDAKRGINDAHSGIPLHRHLSNNSVLFEKRPTRTQLHALFRGIRQEGEPGFVNAEAARKRRADFQGINP